MICNGLIARYAICIETYLLAIGTTQGVVIVAAIAAIMVLAIKNKTRLSLYTFSFLQKTHPRRCVFVFGMDNKTFYNSK